LLAAVTPGMVGDALSISAIKGAQGAVTLANGQVEYTAPNAGVATDAFTYTVADQLGDQAVGDVEVTIDPGPTAGPVSASVDVGDSVDLTSEILAAATPGLAGDVLTITGDAATGALGTIALVNGDLTYTASAAAFQNLAANASETDSFSYTISDQLGDVATGSVGVTVDNPVTSVSGSPYGGGTIQGVSGEEVINASGYSNVIDANGGSGVINAGQGSTTVNAGSGNLTVNLNGYTDTVSGGDGADTISGSQGNATIALGNGDDSVTTGGYNNMITLGNGDDAVNAGQGNETLTLGNGNNNVTASGYNNVITVGNGNNVIAAGAGNETITAGAGDNVISAQGYNNIFTLDGGSDTVSAGDGNDSVTANGGAVTLTFNSWNDYAVLLGGARATIYDQGGGLSVEVASPASTISVSGFDPQIWVDLLNPNVGYDSTGGIVNALTSDGHGGTLLALGTTGSIDFMNMSPSQLHASNFGVG
jgi:Ca2+-binding RTX toxin-like protein